MRTYLGGELAKSSELCEMLKTEVSIVLERTGRYSSWLNGKTERDNQTFCGMMRVATIDHGLGHTFWCCECEDSTEEFNATVHAAHGEVPDYLWYGVCPKISNFRIFRCKVEALIKSHLANLDPRYESGYYIGTTATKAVIRYWRPEELSIIKYYTTS